MSTPVAAVTDSPFPSLEPAENVLAALGAKLTLADQATPEAILAVARRADVLFVTYAQLTAEIIGQLEACKVIGRFGIGIDNIDIDAATKAGIVVTYAPIYCLDEVSDHAMALLLALARKIPYANRLVAEGRWGMPTVVPIYRLKNRTLGLFGFGNISRGLVPKAQGFGIKVIASDPYADDAVFKSLGVERVDFEQLLERSDYLSVHAPLTDETRNMFNADVFRKMKPSALLINTARGPLVDVEALKEALDAGEIAGAALDVLPVEPPPADCPLFGHDKVIITPHAGFYSEDALVDLQTTVAQDVVAVLRGERPKFPVNPQVLD